MKKGLFVFALLISQNLNATGYFEGTFGGLKSVDRTYNNPQQPEVNTLPLWYIYGFNLGMVYKNADLSFGYTNYYTPSVNTSYEGLLPGDFSLTIYDLQALVILPVTKKMDIKLGGSLGYAEIQHKIADEITEQYQKMIYQSPMKITETLDNQIIETFSGGLGYKISEHFEINIMAKYLLLNTVRTRKMLQSNAWIYQETDRINLNSLFGVLGIRVYF